MTVVFGVLIGIALFVALVLIAGIVLWTHFEAMNTGFISHGQ